MVLPHFDYCCTSRGTTSDTNISKLLTNQNRSMCIILQCHPRTHIADMLSSLKWLSIKQRVLFLTVVLVFKIIHSKTLNYMSHWMVPVSHQHGTRGSTLCTKITPEFTHHNRDSTQLQTSICTHPNLKIFKKSTIFFIRHKFNIY